MKRDDRSQTYFSVSEIGIKIFTLIKKNEWTCLQEQPLWVKVKKLIWQIFLCFFYWEKSNLVSKLYVFTVKKTQKYCLIVSSSTSVVCYKAEVLWLQSFTVNPSLLIIAIVFYFVLLKCCAMKFKTFLSIKTLMSSLLKRNAV